MTTRSSATYVQTVITGDLAFAAAEAQSTANERLGGEATLISANTIGETGALTLCTTWGREWEEAELTPAEEPVEEPAPAE